MSTTNASTTDRDEQINRALTSYCRGVDRLDPDAIGAAFHPGAELIDYGPEPTTIEAFIDRVLHSLGTKFVATQHRLSNVRIDTTEAGALVEAYVLAFHVASGADGDTLYTFNGRYIDLFTEIDGAWKVARRHLRVDWSKVEPIDATMGGAWVASGRGGSADPLDG